VFRSFTLGQLSYGRFYEETDDWRQNHFIGRHRVVPGIFYRFWPNAAAPCASHLPRPETIGTLILIWSVLAAIGAVVAAPILFFGRKRAGWAPWQLLLLIVPLLVWALLMLPPLSAGHKSLANLGERLYQLCHVGSRPASRLNWHEDDSKPLCCEFHHRSECSRSWRFLLSSLFARMTNNATLR